MSATFESGTSQKSPAPRNRSVTVLPEESENLSAQLMFPPFDARTSLIDRIVCCDLQETLSNIQDGSVDLLFLDPPYNLDKTFDDFSFKETSQADYETWFASWFELLLPKLARTATVYVCGDWRSSTAIHRVLEKHLIVHNRITWEREKGRGAKHNWKNASEDIWFATVSKTFHFDAEAVKLKRKVLAPYRTDDGLPKDWTQEEDSAFRLTYSSNMWTDLTVPFWSMPENTAHPTQKPEKLMAKLLLASSKPGDLVWDPFVGSGTTAVVAKKLNRHFIASERNENYALWAQKRLQMAAQDDSIQGYEQGVFWERNALSKKKNTSS